MSVLRVVEREQVLPANVDAERLVLGCILLENSLLGEADAELSLGDFYLPSHRKIYTAYRSLAEQGRGIDPMTLQDELRRRGELEQVGGPAYLASLFDGVPRFSTIRDYARTVRERAIQRQLIYAAVQVQQSAFDAEDLPEDQLARARKLLDSIEQRCSTGNLRTVAESGAARLDKLSALYASERPFLGVATGLTDLDYNLGGLQRGEEIIIGARPSMGKSAAMARLVQGVAENRWNPDSVQVVFALETGDEEFTFRLQCALAKVDSLRARNKQLGRDEWRALVAAQDRIAQWKLYLFTQNESSDVRAQAGLLRRVKNEAGKVDVIYCDHLGFCKMSGVDGNNRNVLWDEITKEQKRLAQEYSAPFVVLSQLSRANTARGDKRPQLSDLRESGGIEQNADTVIFLHREHYYDSNADPTLAEWQIAKQRNGPLAKIELYFDRRLAWFESRGREF